MMTDRMSVTARSRVPHKYTIRDPHKLHSVHNDNIDQFCVVCELAGESV